MRIYGNARLQKYQGCQCALIEELMGKLFRDKVPKCKIASWDDENAAIVHLAAEINLTAHQVREPTHS
jgi:hypothetical protein